MTTARPVHDLRAGDWPDVGNDEIACCMGSAEYGPRRCTCWEPVYDVEQLEPRTDLEPGCRPAMCADCAFRPNSPERRGDPTAAADWDALQDLVITGTPFWCHQGIRRPVAFRHGPSGTEITGSALDYTPPQVAGVPYRADGTPADMCGGWAALSLRAAWDAAHG